jgi:hypothetical protein
MSSWQKQKSHGQTAQPMAPKIKKAMGFLFAHGWSLPVFKENQVTPGAGQTSPKLLK